MLLQPTDAHDSLEALLWIRHYIGSLGEDKHKSGGAGAVGALLEEEEG